ncbi:hypothetical protein LTR37_006924 [Vermiconidia calcicola]|uniref:Uncharacterized protein n=1 Tax=Vermiconidia calcicola TaxID=1690605 RepID=A0ACC3NF47_9PEZI|nr:hypothetical protein LTR37_006924 [Vermiconidia calcicola]
MEVGYWIKRDTAQTLASILWKFWRSRFQRSAHVYVSDRQVWTDMESSGDNLLRGSPQAITDSLGIYLNRANCFGHLGEEKVYRDDQASRGLDVYTQPLVLKVLIDPPWKPRTECNQLTRLDVLKQCFEAMVNRMLGFNYKTHVGLITFATIPRVAMGISHVLENFRRTTANMEADGDTALWDSLALAQDQLIEYGKKYPDAQKRIVVISDGADTKSITNTAQDIIWRLKEAGVAPDTLVNALSICELEPFLSLSERPALVPPPGTPRNRIAFMGHFWRAKREARTTTVTEHVFPPRKEHPNLRDEFVQLTAAASRPVNVSSSGSTRSNLRISRLMNEMKSIASSSHSTYDVYVSETDMTFWKVVMSGPDESPYSEGTFMLYIHADENYLRAAHVRPVR